MKLLELLEEYIVLQYPQDRFPKIRRDLELGDYQLVRFGDFYSEVFFLTCGESLKIENKLLHVCSGFYKSRGEEIIRAEDVSGSSLWELIVVCSRIMDGNSIDPGRLKNTEALRSWFRDRFNWNIGPVIYFSRDDVIKL